MVADPSHAGTRHPAPVGAEALLRPPASGRPPWGETLEFARANRIECRSRHRVLGIARIGGFALATVLGPGCLALGAAAAVALAIDAPIIHLGSASHIGGLVLFGGVVTEAALFTLRQYSAAGSLLRPLARAFGGRVTVGLGAEGRLPDWLDEHNWGVVRYLGFGGMPMAHALLESG